MISQECGDITTLQGFIQATEPVYGDVDNVIFDDKINVISILKGTIPSNQQTWHGICGIPKYELAFLDSLD